ncbi:MAG TPA: GIY-YIG nuclease family protein [Candidatus Acidoferrales bacterium]|nr:GIY-YIG nuclease family protein [Candidatus Acidoferrales bacterium]
MQMNYSYVLLSQRDDRFYIGSTGDLRERLQQHHAGRVDSTAHRRPVRLVYYEACLNVQDARRRERYLKSGRGGRYLKRRLASWLSEIRSTKLERHEEA